MASSAFFFVDSLPLLAPSASFLRAPPLLIFDTPLTHPYFTPVEPLRLFSNPPIKSHFGNSTQPPPSPDLILSPNDEISSLLGIRVVFCATASHPLHRKKGLAVWL